MKVCINSLELKFSEISLSYININYNNSLILFVFMVNCCGADLFGITLRAEEVEFNSIAISNDKLQFLDATGNRIKFVTDRNPKTVWLMKIKDNKQITISIGKKSLSYDAERKLAYLSDGTADNSTWSLEPPVADYDFSSGSFTVPIYVKLKDDILYLGCDDDGNLILDMKRRKFCFEGWGK